MALILEMPTVRTKAGSADRAAAARRGEVVLFPGVRYERHAPAAPSEPTAVVMGNGQEFPAASAPPWQPKRPVSCGRDHLTLLD